MLTGQKVIVRCIYDNLPLGVQWLSAQGAELIETQNDVNQITNWHKRGITRREDTKNIYSQEVRISKYIPIKEDSWGTRETRHVIRSNQVVNSSRLLYSLKLTVPKSHKLKAQEIADLVKKNGMFPLNYILDLDDFIDGDCSYLDIVGYNPLSCSMCVVNNNVFDIAEIEEKHKQLQMGFEFCYDVLSLPLRYELIRVSNKKYTYISEK